MLVAAFLSTKDVMIADAAFQTRVMEGLNLAFVQRFGDPEATRRSQAMMPMMSLLMGSSFSALIVLALTRPRARAFFREQPSGPLSEG